jgi:DUF3108-like
MSANRSEDLIGLRRAGATLAAAALALTVACGCNSPVKPGNASAPNFFPLGKNFTWTYQVDSKSQQQKYIVVDKVRGEEYVPALKMSAEVVDEFTSMRRGGLRPVIYYQTADGYLTRLSGLDYSGNKITTPPWGRSEEDKFLPSLLMPDRTWDNLILPYGHLNGSPEIAQHHHSFIESKTIQVPAGAFTGCIRIETNAAYSGGLTTGRHMKLYYLDWYAPNIGLVRSLTLEGGGKGPVMERVELLRYDLRGIKGH